MTEQQIQKLLDDHLAYRKRRANTALAMPSLQWLDKTVRMTLPTDGRILDLGSGSSTLLFRTIQRDSADNISVWTVDTWWQWLAHTMFECEQQRLNTEHMMCLDQFVALPEDIVGRFDLIFLDVNESVRRQAMLPDIHHMYMKPTSLLLLDDWHFPHYRKPMTIALNKLGYKVTSLEKETKDQFGRYMAVAQQDQQ